MRILQSFIAMAIAPCMAMAADNYPSKPLRMVIPYTPGGPTDLVGRALASKLQDALGQQVIVDNRSGGGGVIATEIVARAPADGVVAACAARASDGRMLPRARDR